MNGFTHTHQKQATQLLQRGINPFRACLVVTIKSVTDVLSPAGKNIFITLEGRHGISHTKPKLIPNDAGEQFDLDEQLEFFAVFGRRPSEVLLEEQTIKNGCPVNGFFESFATVAEREDGMNDKVRDYGTVNLVEFVYGKHSITDKVIDMKLGGCVAVTVECLLESWESDNLRNNNVSTMADVGDGNVVKMQFANREYGQVYKTTCSGGEWIEYPVVCEMEQPRKLKFWSIDGPDESDSESDSELEQVCEPQYRVARRRMKKCCKIGEIAKTGKMSLLQKYKVWAIQPFIGNIGETCTLESLKERDYRKQVLSTEVRFVEDGGLSDDSSDDDDDDDDGTSENVNVQLVKRRISDCSDCDDVDVET